MKATRELQAEFDRRWQSRQIDGQLHQLADLAADMEDPRFWDDPERARELSTKKSAMEKQLVPWQSLRSDLTDFPDLIDLTMEEMGDPKAAIESIETDFDRLEQRLEDLLLSEALMGEDDPANAIITISSGAGGTESQDWAEMLLRMYTRWTDDREFTLETLDLQPGEEAGIKSASLLVKGPSAYGYLKSENGIHRLVRISPFDSNKRRHTSFAAVHVMPDIDDAVEVDIDEKDLRVDTYRASGAGGQHINKTDSAIRITHIPTGIVVQCQNERSQHKNRSMAMKMLKARLHELEKEKIEQDIESRSGEKKDAAWGNQIRSYVFHPYKMVKDLRTQYETSNVDGVMDGDLDPFIEAYLKSIAGADARRSQKVGDA
ncbi:MAG: peptide chain release factor 2 [Leptospiraceae bacterium]|nr:peptide chain release factor 2 [Leptospiraceae bacterium]